MTQRVAVCVCVCLHVCVCLFPLRFRNSNDMKWFSVNSRIQTLQCKSAVSLCSRTESSWVIVCSDSVTVNLADIFLFIVDSLSCQVKKTKKNACYSFPEPVLTLWKSDQLSQSQRFSGYFESEQRKAANPDIFCCLKWDLSNYSVIKRSWRSILID